MRFWVFILAVSLFSLETGCANLRGIPQELDAADITKLGDEQLQTVLSVSDILSAKYKTARNDNLNYVFWSNVPLIGAAAAAASAIYAQSSSNVLAGIGLFAGTLSGANVFINAKSNSATYQGGINALTCISSTLAVFTKANRTTAVTTTLKQDVDTLDAAIRTHQPTLDSAKIFSFDTEDARAEVRRSPPGIMDVFNGAQKTLADALSAATTTSASGHNELNAFATMNDFASQVIRSVDQLVTSKVSQPTVDFASLRDSITATISADVAAKSSKGQPPVAASPPAAASSTAQPRAAANAQPPLATPILDKINQFRTATIALGAAITPVTQQIITTGVISAETKVNNDCLKKI